MGVQQKILPFQLVKATPAIASGVLTLDLAGGANYFAVTNNANITSFVIQNAPPGPCSFMLELKANGSGFTQAWGGSVSWGSVGAPTLTTTNNKRDKLLFDSTDGTTFDAAVYGQAF